MDTKWQMVLAKPASLICYFFPFLELGAERRRFHCLYHHEVHAFCLPFLPHWAPGEWSCLMKQLIDFHLFSLR